MGIFDILKKKNKNEEFELDMRIKEMNARYEVLTNKENLAVWKKFNSLIECHPSPNARGKAFIFPSSIKYTVFNIDDVPDGYANYIDEIFKKMISEDEFMYSLEWQSSGFRFNPYKPAPSEEFIEVPYDEPVGVAGWTSYRAYYPQYLPDGDYYFFLASDLSWGYLGHPWQRKLYIYGEQFIKTFNAEFNMTEITTSNIKDLF